MADVTQPSRLRVGRPAGPPTKVVRLPASVADLARKVAARSMRAAEINAFFDVAAERTTSIPLMTHTAVCGLPSPADDHVDCLLDFNELLIKNPKTTFAVRVAGDSMVGAGLFPGDIAIVDRLISATDGAIVLALLDGDFTIKRYRQKGSRIWLQAENLAYRDLKISEHMSFEVWGVVPRAIRMFGES
jgi:DNA polymerase V